MREDVKRFIEQAVQNGKDKKYVRDFLYGKIKDLEVVSALEYYDKLKNSKTNKFFSFFIYIKGFLRFISIFLFYLFLKLVVSLKKLIGKKEEKEIKKIEELDKEKNYLKDFFKKISNWFKKKSKREKRNFILLSLFFSILFLTFVYANFFYYKKCDNKTCFMDLTKNCDRAMFESEDFIFLVSRIEGRGLNNCYSNVIYFDKENKKKMEMKCVLPLGQSFLPYSNIEFCSGELREFIQGKILSELEQSVGQNIFELNNFFKK